ncbi:MAG TPA: restriction endonuclease subunit S, partial [Verrucomicrobiae bacterium]|nr:restriction endonuclease subunit S [Verrucomicrobiae bacterium]
IKVKTQFTVRTDDFLISKRQIVHNACGLVPSYLDGSIVSNEYSVLTPREGCDIRFFSYFAQQRQVSKSFLDSSVGIVIEKMLFKLEWWLNHEFLFPSVREQERIASCLGSLDTLINEQAKKLDTLKTHKQGLMQGLFPTPPKEVPDAV